MKAQATHALAAVAGLALAAGTLVSPSRDPGRQLAAGYAISSRTEDTLRVRLAAAGDARAGLRRPDRSRRALLAPVTGYFSPRGLPPVAGLLSITDTGLVFRSTDGRYAATLPVVGPVRHSTQGVWRAPAVSLAYVDQALGRPSYLFRLDGGVFTTDAPGGLLDIVAHPGWLDSLASREWITEGSVVDGRDAVAVGALLDAVLHGGYADSLYALFGRPARSAGLVGARGRAAGRLGEYVASRDSLALDPARMTSQAQLRHTLAHELAHRWQAHSSAQLALLWAGVPPIRDAKRYGHDSVIEHQAEAAAFAVHFLLTTAASGDAATQLGLLDHYELLVPGTRTLARYFVMQPKFSRHPLRSALTR